MSVKDKEDIANIVENVNNMKSMIGKVSNKYLTYYSRKGVHSFHKASASVNNRFENPDAGFELKNQKPSSTFKSVTREKRNMVLMNKTNPPSNLKYQPRYSSIYK